jgi:8-oxo-dGTP diphosphatase
MTSTPAPSTRERPRASAAVLRADDREILMVRHQRPDGMAYWQLPGGGLLPGEQPEEAALRELREETGLVGTIIRHLFTLPYRLGLSTTFLVAVAPNASATLGLDPEEAHGAHRKLTAVASWPLAEMADNPEVAQLLHVLHDEAGPTPLRSSIKP